MSTKWFKTSFAAAPSLKVDVETGTIKGVAIARVGEAKGHGVFLDQEFINEIVRLGNAKQNAKGEPSGIKVRFGHPNMCSTALGTFLGRAKNFYVEGEFARADLFLSRSAKDAPGGDLFNYVLQLAKTNPDMFGMSIVFEPGQSIKIGEDGIKIPETDPEFDSIDGNVFTSINKLLAADVVDDPAATDDGIFSAKFGNESFAGMVTEFLDLHPHIYKIVHDNPSVMQEFMARYDEYQTKLKLKLADAKEDNMQDEVSEVEELKINTAEEVADLVDVEDDLEEVESSTEDIDIEIEVEVEDEVEDVNAEEVEVVAAESADENEQFESEEEVESPGEKLKRFKAEFGDVAGIRAFEQDMTYDEAKEAHYAFLKEEVESLKNKKSNVELSDLGGDPIEFDDGGDVLEDYDSLIESYKAEGKSLKEAVTTIRSQHTDAYSRYIESKNKK
jgi:hypothetical protein